jgi:hypothetical protein
MVDLATIEYEHWIRSTTLINKHSLFKNIIYRFHVLGNPLLQHKIADIDREFIKRDSRIMVRWSNTPRVPSKYSKNV